MNYFERKIAKAIPNATQIEKVSEKEYVINTILPFMTHRQKFVPGKEIKNKSIDGREVTSIFTFDKNKIIERQVEPKRVVIIVREFYEDKMLGESIVGNVTNNYVCRLIE